MLALDETIFNPGVQVILCLDVLEGFLLLVNEDDVNIRLLFVALDEVLKDVALSYTTRADQSDDVALPDPGINNICVMLSSQYFHSTNHLSNAKIVKFYCPQTIKARKISFSLFTDNKILDSYFSLFYRKYSYLSVSILLEHIWRGMAGNLHNIVHINTGKVHQSSTGSSGSVAVDQFVFLSLYLHQLGESSCLRNFLDVAIDGPVDCRTGTKISLQPD